MYHISMVFKVRDMFMASSEACVTRMATEDESLRWHCGIDQRLFSVMKDQQPEMFLKIGRGKNIHVTHYTVTVKHNFFLSYYRLRNFSALFVCTKVGESHAGALG